jgi:hypothetical protein
MQAIRPSLRIRLQMAFTKQVFPRPALPSRKYGRLCRRIYRYDRRWTVVLYSSSRKLLGFAGEVSRVDSKKYPVSYLFFGRPSPIQEVRADLSWFLSSIDI